MRKTIQIGNLPYSVGDRHLARLFAPHGSVHSAKVCIHFDTGLSTGVGFVEMDSDQDGESAIAALNGRPHGGRILAVCWSKPCSDSRGTPQEMFGPMNMADDISPTKGKPERRGLP